LKEQKSELNRQKTTIQKKDEESSAVGKKKNGGQESRLTASISCASDLHITGKVFKQRKRFERLDEGVQQLDNMKLQESLAPIDGVVLLEPAAGSGTVVGRT